MFIYLTKSSLKLTSFLAFALVASAFMIAALAPTAGAQATRTWVSGVGDDVNPCSRTAPCKTFAGAISKTAENGEIDALDPAGFGAVTITKAITIDGAGTLASILNAGTTGIIINAGIDDDVIVRNLSINGGGVVSPTCPFAGITGINVLKGRTVRLENLTIQNQQVGVKVSPNASNPDLFFDVLLHNVNISNTCQYGIQSIPAPGYPVRLGITDSTLSNTNVGLHVEGGTQALVSDSNFFLNNLGVETPNGGEAKDFGGNTFAGNAADGALAPLVPAAPAPTPPVVYCVVPKLTGASKSSATSKLKAANCAIGRSSTKRTSKKSQKNKVLSQSVPSGISAKLGTKINIVLGK
jgi:hypothetical protein